MMKQEIIAATLCTKCCQWRRLDNVPNDIQTECFNVWCFAQTSLGGHVGLSSGLHVPIYSDDLSLSLAQAYSFFGNICVLKERK